MPHACASWLPGVFLTWLLLMLVLPARSQAQYGCCQLSIGCAALVTRSFCEQVLDGQFGANGYCGGPGKGTCIGAATGCTSACDCPTGQPCSSGKCLPESLVAVYCCASGQCPAGEQCDDPDGTRHFCPGTGTGCCLTWNGQCLNWSEQTCSGEGDFVPDSSCATSVAAACVKHTPTPTRTPTRTRQPATATATPTVTPTVTPTPRHCPCDCNGNGRVDIDDFTKAANILVGRARFEECLVFDANRNGRIDIDDFTTAATMVLKGCR